MTPSIGTTWFSSGLHPIRGACRGRTLCCGNVLGYFSAELDALAVWTFTAPEMDVAADRVGNTTLLEPAVNRRAGGSPYPQKRIAYEQNACTLTRWIAEMVPEEWNFALMEARQRQLAARAVPVWRSDFAGRKEADPPSPASMAEYRPVMCMCVE